MKLLYLCLICVTKSTFFFNSFTVNMVLSKRHVVKLHNVWSLSRISCFELQLNIKKVVFVLIRDNIFCNWSKKTVFSSVDRRKWFTLRTVDRVPALINSSTCLCSKRWEQNCWFRTFFCLKRQFPNEKYGEFIHAAEKFSKCWLLAIRGFIVYPRCRRLLKFLLYFVSFFNKFCWQYISINAIFCGAPMSLVQKSLHLYQLTLLMFGRFGFRFLDSEYISSILLIQTKPHVFFSSGQA